jgi:hypothetical protein
MQIVFERIEHYIDSLKKQAISLVKEVQALLKTQKPQKNNPDDPKEIRAKAVWVHFKERKDYDTFSIVWSKVKFFHHETKRPFYEDVARGRSFCINRNRFMALVRGYHPEIQKELFGYEQEFAKIRQKQALLSEARVRITNFQKLATKPEAHLMRKA